MEDYGKLIQKKYPNMTFKFMQNVKGSTLEDIVTSKTKIDFFFGGSADIQRLKDIGLLGNVTDLVTKNKLDLNKIEPTAINIMKRFTDGIPGFPVKVNSSALFFNKDLFDKFGVPYLTDTMTWDAVFEAARKRTRPN